MHELALTQQIVEACSAKAGTRRVGRVTLRIGSLAAVLPDALRFCFDVCAQDTPLQGAELEIIAVPGRGRCHICGAHSDMESFVAVCRCGATGMECIAGTELQIQSFEVL